MEDYRVLSNLKRHLIHHNKDLVSGLRLLQEETSLCDVTLNVGTRNFQAHRVVLSAVSGYFKAMFTSGFEESSKSEVTIDGDGGTFGKLFDFVYSGDLCLSTDTVVDVINMACYLQLHNAIGICTDYVNDCYKDVDVSALEIALQVSAIARCHNLQDMENTANLFLTKNFAKFSETVVFLEDVKVDVLEMFLDRSDLTVLSRMNEEQVLKAVTTWLLHDWTNRQGHGKRLLGKVHLGMVPVTKLKKYMNATMRSRPECKELLQDVLENKCKENTSETRGVKLLLAYGGQYLQMYYYNRQAEWRNFNKFAGETSFRKHGRYHSGVCGKRLISCGDRLFMFGSGWNMYYYNAITNSWKPLPNRKEDGLPVTLACLEEVIYGVGSRQRIVSDVQNQFHAYDMKAKCWQMLPDLPTPTTMGRGAPAAIGYQGKLLVYWEHLENTWELYMYDPGTQTWFRLEGNEVQDFVVSLVVIDDMCYRIIYIEDEENNFKSINVQQLVCSLDGDNPSVSLGEVHDQKDLRCLDIECPSILAFTINKEVYVDLDASVHNIDCIYKLMHKLGGDDEGKICAMIRNFSAFKQSRGYPILFTEHKFEKLHHDVVSANSLAW